MTAEQKENLRRCRDYIVTTLNPTYVLCYMEDLLSDETVECIRELKGTPTAAAELLLKSILELTSEKWFRAFLDALYASGYSGLYQAIENWDFQTIENLENYRKFLKKIKPGLLDIDPDQVLPFMKDCIRQQEWEEIKQAK